MAKKAGRITQSQHYKKQDALKGSVREVRGQVIRVLASKDMSLKTLQKEVAGDERFTLAVDGLLSDGLVAQTDGKLHLTK